MIKWIVVYSCYRIVHSYEKGWTMDTHNTNEQKKLHTEKAHSGWPCLHHILEQNQSMWIQSCGYLSRVSTTDEEGTQRSFLGSGNVLYLHLVTVTWVCAHGKFTKLHLKMTSLHTCVHTYTYVYAYMQHVYVYIFQRKVGRKGWREQEGRKLHSFWSLLS